MKLYIAIFTGILLCYTVFLAVRAQIFIRKIKVQELFNKKQETSSTKMVIAIPCLREQTHIEDTIKYFSSIAPDVPIVIITTQKEIKENTIQVETTQNIVKNKILPQYTSVYWVDYPYVEGYMAEQLNYMLENLEEILKQKIDRKNTYLALYNADSRPSPKTFQEIKVRLEKKPKVLQQYSYCMQNYEKISNILKGFAMYQSNFEMKGLMNAFFQTNILYTYVVGHGLVINLETLQELGNFNTQFWCEDMYLSMQLKFRNIKIQPLLELENIETPTTLSSLIKQNAVWFKTTSQYGKMYQDIKKKKTGEHKLRGFIGAFNEFRCAINWAGFPIAFLAGVIGAIAIKQYFLFYAIIATFCLYVSVNTVTTVQIINVLDEKKYKINFRMLINTIFATGISNIGPIYSMMIRKKEKYKTER